jgi:spore germination protein GerM
MNRRIYIVIVIIGLLLLGGVILFSRSPQNESVFSPGEENGGAVVPDEEGTAALNVTVYYSNFDRGGDDCEAVFPITRQIPRTEQVVRAALEQLFRGPTPSEIGEGYTSNIPDNVRVNNVTIEEGVARADFSEELNNIAGSCAVQSVRSQINQTLRQFTGVDDVIISVNGRTEDALQP